MYRSKKAISGWHLIRYVKRNSCRENFIWRHRIKTQWSVSGEWNIVSVPNRLIANIPAFKLPFLCPRFLSTYHRQNRRRWRWRRWMYGTASNQSQINPNGWARNDWMTTFTTKWTSFTLIANNLWHVHKCERHTYNIILNELNTTDRHRGIHLSELCVCGASHRWLAGTGSYSSCHSIHEKCTIVVRWSKRRQRTAIHINSIRPAKNAAEIRKRANAVDEKSIFPQNVIHSNWICEYCAHSSMHVCVWMCCERRARIVFVSISVTSGLH